MLQYIPFEANVFWPIGIVSQTRKTLSCYDSSKRSLIEPQADWVQPLGSLPVVK